MHSRVKKIDKHHKKSTVGLEHGYFITFEGPEGSGKSTQATMLTHELKERGYEVMLTREPGGTRISNEIRKILLSKSFREIRPLTELFLFSAGRAQHIEEKIIPNLEKGKIVICDRFTDSTIAYQGFGRNFALDTINHLNELATRAVVPDLTFLLNINVEEGLLRAMQLHKDSVSGKGDRFETEEIDFHRRVQNGFLDLLKKNPDRIVYIDASKNKQQIQEQIQKVLYERLNAQSKE